MRLKTSQSPNISAVIAPRNRGPAISYIRENPAVRGRSGTGSEGGRRRFSGMQSVFVGCSMMKSEVRRGIYAVSAWVGAMLAVLAAGAGAQDNNAACTLRGRDTVLTSGLTVKKCLDVPALNGQIVTIPKNVTRIDNTGFALCEASETLGGLADIVYVMDQSGSMALEYVWVSPNGQDTIYVNSLYSCGNSYTQADRTNYGTMTVLNQGGTRQVNKLNPAKDPRDRCTDLWSGDPFSQRAIAFRGAIDYQAQRAPASRAGYIGFAGELMGTTSPRQLNTPANITAVQQEIVIRNQNNTNYTIPLTQAKTWLNNAAMSPNSNKAIIFLSDGKPTQPSNNPQAYLSLLGADMPPVYGIFLGVPRQDTLLLAELSAQTGGRFFLIPPNRPDSLRTVVERILNIILRQYQPNKSEVVNSTILPNQRGYAGPTDFTRQDATSWLINFDKPVGLNKEMGNAIRLSTQMRDAASGDTADKAANFQLSTTGPEERVNRNLPGTQFSIVCQDLPPDINLVKKAYIRDVNGGINGDGAGDKVFFEFSRPLLKLPDSIVAAYWNKVAPGFENQVKPVLSFLPGSNSTILVADFSVKPFAKGLTSIPPGEKPVGILQPGGVFQGQQPAIEDSMGTIILSGFSYPYDNSRGSSGSFNIDTLVVNVSEPMETGSDWESLIYWGKQVNNECNDFANAKQLVTAREPTQSADQKTFTLLVSASQSGGSPVKGDCIYLNVSGTHTDVHGNIPPVYGVELQGREPPRQISVFRGYPPVVGFTADRPGFAVVNNESRNGGGGGYSKPDQQTGAYVITWVPPANYPDPSLPKVDFEHNPRRITDPNTPTTGLPDPSKESVFPQDISAIQVVSTGKYIAEVSIFDSFGNFVQRFVQPFGYMGELNNSARVVPKGLVSYLVWNMKDSKGQKAGHGVYIWKVLFTFETGKQEIQYTRTGLTRPLGM